MKRKSFCRICTALCGLEVELDGDRVIRVNGDRDNPLSEGFSCFKGRYAVVPAHLHQPLVLRLVLLNGATPTARRFHDWLLSPEGRRLLARHGYQPPA